MPLITVFFPGPRKAIIDQAHKKYFFELGAVEHQAEAEIDQPKAEEIQPEPAQEQIPLPDEGFGRPGSLQWHKLKIQEITQVTKVSNYCKDVTGKGVSARDGVIATRKRAIKRIKEFIENGKNP